MRYFALLLRTPSLGEQLLLLTAASGNAWQALSSSSFSPNQKVDACRVCDTQSTCVSQFVLEANEAPLGHLSPTKGVECKHV